MSMRLLTCPGAKACVLAVAPSATPQRYRLARKILGIPKSRGSKRTRNLSNHRYRLRRRAKDDAYRMRVNKAVCARRRAREKATGGCISARDLRWLWEWQAGTCFWCDAPMDASAGGHHLDHVMPLSRGGAHDRDNAVLSCPQCNRAKAALWPWEWRPALFSEVFVVL